MTGKPDQPRRDKTRLVQLGRKNDDYPAPVNIPVMRASTMLFDTIANANATLAKSNAGLPVLRYGARGTANAFALQEMITDIEGGDTTMLFPTGLAAIAHIFISLLRSGDHVLLAESIYRPARELATDFLPQRGIDCEFYDGGHEQMAKRLRPETRMVYLDNPGSIIYDIQDVPAMAKILDGRDTLLVVDNTWGAAGLYRPLQLGADISVIAVTKYIAGHSDIMMGSVTANARCAGVLKKDALLLGQTVSPDDAYLALRGIRSAAARLAMHQSHAREVVAWLQTHPLVERILYPALETDPGHALWKRDFDGANGLFTLEFKPHITQEHANSFAESLQMFGIGVSWGGFESLVLVYAAVPGWSGGRVARLHIGLEDPRDLITDLDNALAQLPS